MNYYPHHIGDFNNATRHLTRVERSIYRDMIELYYDIEQPLTIDTKALCRRLLARTDEESTAVEQVLNEFFTETASGWYHDRCEEEIERYRSLSTSHWTRLLTPEARSANESIRRAMKLSAAPPWLDAEHKRKIQMIYSRARQLSIETGVPHEVDHIIPLRSKVVCGLHVAWNLRVITAEKNRAKSNAIIEVW